MNYVLVKCPQLAPGLYYTQERSGDYQGEFLKIRRWCIDRDITYTYRGRSVAKGVEYFAFVIPDDNERLMFTLKWK